MKDTKDYDLLIIGSGSAAFAAAIQAVSYGAKVGMIERGTVGGTCVNIGCVPSKTLLRAGEIHRLSAQNPFAGLTTPAVSATPATGVDMGALIAEKNKLVQELREHKYIDLVDNYGFDLIHGEARFVSEDALEVNGQRLTAHKFLIATGASPAVPDIPGLSDVDYLDSTAALELREVPRRLVVIGMGYIALELGQLFHNLGAKVTLTQRGPRLLPSLDVEVSQTVRRMLTHQGIRVVTGATFNRVDCVDHRDHSEDRDPGNRGDHRNGAPHTKRLYLTVDGVDEVIEGDQILVAAGRRPNVAALNLEAANVEVNHRGAVGVDKYLRTSNHRVYAAGDITTGPQFVYVAAYEGQLAAANALSGRLQKLDLRVVPQVTFTTPAIATVGLTQQQAKANGVDVVTSILPLNAVPRALVNRETTGVFKLVADAHTHKLLGVQIVADNAGDVIYAATLMVKFGLTALDVQSTLAPYLTMAEGLKLAALTLDKDVSTLSCCAG